jgi:hypothetical protein
MISLPENTFPVWEKEANSSWSIKNDTIQTKVPIIPAIFYPEGNIDKYYVLFEVDDWKVVTKDPILLKRMTKNLFAIVACWDLTPLEQAIVRGR